VRATNPLEGAFCQGNAVQPSMRVLRRSSLQVSEIWSDHRDLVVRGTVPRDDAYVVTLHLRDRPRGAMAAESRWLQTRNFQAGNCGIVDLRMHLESEYAGAFHYLSFYLTRAALDAATEDAGAPRVGDLRHQPGVGVSDPVVWHLLCALAPALTRPSSETSALFADHVARAFVLHMASTYGDMRSGERLARGGLAPWQQRRARELIDARLDGTLSLTELARVCDLSVRHFARAFRQSTGQSPHRWLTHRRLEKAKALLDGSAQSLAEIAQACGFASQSHFTRVFTRAVGTSPGAWRRERRA
jgi:AraC-like DNA-binding protein